MKKLVISCTVGWAYRNLIHTKVVEELSNRYKVVLLCNEITYKPVKEILHNKTNIQVERINLKSSFLANKLKSLLSLILIMRIAPNTSKWIYPKLTSYKLVNKVLPIFEPIIRNLYLFLISKETIKKNLKHKLGKVDKFIFTSPFGWEDQLFQMNVNNDCDIYHLYLSWDNIYSKGFSLKAKKYLVWTDFMKSTVALIHKCPLEDIHTIEVPHLGGVSQKNDIPKKNLLYSCISGKNYPNEIGLVRQIKDWFVKDLNKYFDKFIIRTHPAGPNFIFDELEDHSRNIFVSHPSKAKEESLYFWNPDETELNTLSDLMASSITNINVASTMSIDARTHNCEILNIAFHDDESLDAQVKSYYLLDHYKNLVQLGIVKVIYRKNDLKSAIIDTAINPDRRSQEKFDSIFDASKSSFKKLFNAID
tara:strand:+ start:1647 stop:2906 length:1260 start_codon:yes stop_codon:yes gene_type:complete